MYEWTLISLLGASLLVLYTTGQALAGYEDEQDTAPFLLIIGFAVALVGSVIFGILNIIMLLSIAAR